MDSKEIYGAITKMNKDDDLMKISFEPDLNPDL